MCKEKKFNYSNPVQRHAESNLHGFGSGMHLFIYHSRKKLYLLMQW